MEFLLLLPVLIFSVILHEVSHGLAALNQGDETALASGRLTLNPLPHLDLMGSVILPAICLFTHAPVFGWAKPVPVNPNRFRHYRSGVVLVSLAGPLTNFMIALAGVVILFFIAAKTSLAVSLPFLPQILSQAVLLNLVLAVFNLLPVPPLDGSKVLSVLLPPELAQRYDALEPYGLWIVLALMLTGVLGRVLYPVVYFFYSHLLSAFGLWP